MDRWSRDAPRTAYVLLIVLAAGTALALGGVHVPVVLAAGVVGVLLATTLARTDSRPSAPVWIAFGLAVYSGFQALPLPASWLTFIAPENADVWARALRPLGESGPAFASISLAPSLSLVEAVKWMNYGLVFWGASYLASERSSASVVGIVFGVGVATAVVTVLHGLVDAQRVYGWYEAATVPGRWAVGPFVNSNNLAGYLNFCAICGLGLLATRHARRRWPIALGVTLMVAVSIAAASRGGLAALPIGLAVFLVLQLALGRPGRDRTRVVLLATAALAGGLLLAGLAVSRTTWQDAFSAELSKLALVSWSLPLIRQFWMVGVGRGAFGSAFRAYQMPDRDLVYEYPENFMVQWLSEWGVPATIIALAAVGIAGRRLFGGRRTSSLTMAVIGATVALVLHNLVDLAFEVHAVCLSVALGLGAVWPTRMGQAVETRLTRLSPWMIAVTAVALFSVTIAARPRELASERRRAYAHYSTFLSTGGVADLHRALRDSMKRFPSEPYFARLGALAALRGAGDPMPWIQRALERELHNGRNHLILSDVLARRGAENQALMELRIAMELHSDLVGQGVRRALQLTSDPEQLRRVVPRGPNRGAVLHGLAGGSKDEVRQAFLIEATRAEPPSRAARLALANDALARLSSSEERQCTIGTESCARVVRDQAAALQKAGPTPGSAAAELMIRLAILERRPEDAWRWLAQCQPLPATGRCPELAVELALSEERTDKARSLAEEALGPRCRGAVECGAVATRLAQIFARFGDSEGAWHFYERAAKELDDDDAWHRAWTAAEQAGRYGNALQILGRLSRRAPGDASLRAHIARLELAAHPSASGLR